MTAVAAAVNAHHLAAVADRHLLVAETTLLARMTVVNAIVTTMTAAAPEALTIATEK